MELQVVCSLALGHILEMSSTATRPNDAQILPPPQTDGVVARALRFLFSFRVLMAVGLAVVGLMTIGKRFNDPDLWFHLKLGEIVWNTHSVPTQDLFSFTVSGHPWTAHEWLAQTSIFAAYRFGGYSGVMVWFSALTALLLVLVYALCYRQYGSGMVAFLGGLCAWLFAIPSLAVRPLLPGHVFLVVELLLLEAGIRNRRYLWALPPLFAVWVNCHGSYFFGLGVLGVYWVSSFLNGRWGLIVAESGDRDTRKWLTGALVLCGLALCANPVGFRLLLYPLDTMFQQKTGLSAVQEWQPPDLANGHTLAMIGVVIGICAISLVRRSELRVRDLLLLAAGFWLALHHSRMMFLFGIVVSPMFSRAVAPFIGPDRKRELPVANAVLMLAAAAVAVFAFPAKADLETQVTKGNPVGAVDYIRKAGLSGPMLNEYVFGDYLIWAMPEHKVFIDGRGDVYDWTGVFPEYGRWATLSEDPKILLNKYGIRFCVLSKDSPMGNVLPYMGWSRAYSDENASIFVRDGQKPISR
jgi:hypothetical protein